MRHTASGNPVMLRINERLGCRPVSTEIRLVKTLEAAGHDDAGRVSSRQLKVSIKF